MSTSSSDPEHYDYTAELSDDRDEIQFGKYKGLTPFQVLGKDAAYICWATNKTHHWVGSETIVGAAFRKAGMHRASERPAGPTPKQRTSPSSLARNELQDYSTQEFEDAILAHYGVFPKPFNLSSHTPYGEPPVIHFEPIYSEYN